MKPESVLEIFEKTGALLSGHFLLTSGQHSRQYFQCARVLQFPDYAEQLCSQIASHFSQHNISAVAAPAVGGIIVAHETARHLEARAIFTEREGSQMALRRGFEVKSGERVLVVEDVVTTGGSVGEVIALIKSLRGVPIAVGSLVDRSGGMINIGVEL
ncbi:MAG TPA: orotate phosphoribosyltransferase, partial [bacterium]